MTWGGYKEPEDYSTPGVDDRPKVRAWRIKQLVAAGYMVGEAQVIAGSEADLHRAVEMLEQGCDPALAVKILT
jgi:hypothetical protein